MALTLVTVDGQKTSAGAAAALSKLKAAFKARWGMDLILSSGYRTYEQQKSTFLNAYRVEVRPWVKGPYGDVRWWNGKRYIRVGGEGTVAQPGTSRHEKASAVDLRDSGSTPGVSSRTPNARRDWLKANAPRFGFQPTGYGFDEPWHYDYTGSHEVPPGAGGGSATGGGESKENDMTPEQANQLDQLYKAVFKGGPSMQEDGNSISASLAKIYNSVKPVKRDGRSVAMRQEIADTKTVVLQLQASQSGLEAAIQALATAKGFDPEAIRKAAQQGVEDGLKNVTFSASVD